MKTQEELNALTEETETLNKKLAELTDEELAQIAGGVHGPLCGSCYPQKDGMSCVERLKLGLCVQLLS